MIPAALQLYTLRTLLDRDIEGTLAAVAGIGYRDVELAGFHGYPAMRMRTALDGVGLRAVAGHVGYDTLVHPAGREAALADALALNQSFVVCPATPEPLRTADGYREVAATLNTAGELAHAAGLRLAYHNHDFDFAADGGTVAYDVLLEQTDPELVAFELDLYWAAVAGVDPLALFERAPGRFPLVHVKDRAADGAFADLGSGTLDLPRLLTAAARAGARHLIVEHDEPADPLASATAGHAYLRDLAVS